MNVNNCIHLPYQRIRRSGRCDQSLPADRFEIRQRFSHGRQIGRRRHAARRGDSKRHHIAGVDRAGKTGIGLENEADAFTHHVVDDRRSAASIGHHQ
jgi:hypothetical protein